MSSTKTKKKAIFSFSIQFNSKVYSVPIANMYFNTKPNFLLSKSKSMIEAYKRFIQNIMNSLVEPISNQHKNLLYLAKTHSVQYKPNFVKPREYKYRQNLQITSSYTTGQTCLTIQSPNFISQTFNFIKLIQQQYPNQFN